MKTAHQPAGGLASNLNPLPITDRPGTAYHSRQEVESVEWWKKIKARWNDAKFELSIKAIFIFAVIVSFSHTIELYSSVGFDDEIGWLNELLRVDFITLALFATLAAEAAFAVGLWGLYEAYKQHQRFPRVKEFWQIWTLFGGGLAVVGWSNIGGTVGYDFLVGQPVKGIALGLSIPLFVLGAVLVNFKRKHPAREPAEGLSDQPSNQSTSHVAEPASQPDQPEPSHQPATQTQPTNSHSASDQPTSQSDESPTVSQPETASQLVEAQPAKDGQPDRPVDEPASHHQADQNSQPSATASQANQPVKDDQPTTDSQTDHDQQPAKTASQNSQPRKGSRPASNQKKQPAKRVSTIQPAGKVAEVAEKYRKEKGDWPSQRQLAELAGVSRYQAAKVLNQLDDQSTKSTNQPPVSQANG